MTEAPTGTSVTQATSDGIPSRADAPVVPGPPRTPRWRGWPVGARVVVRRALPGGGLGDVLGDLLEVAADGVLVATRRGPVRVHAADVVLAKRVPPPPVRRPAAGRGEGT